MLPEVWILFLFCCISNASVVFRRQTRGDETAKAKHLSIYYLHVNSDIQSRFATTLITSRIANRHTEALEATFHVVLPNSAFISNFSLTDEDRTFVAAVKEKQKAKEDYDRARQLGQSAAHIAQKSPRESNTFEVSVNIAAGSKVTFNLTYQEILQRSYGVYRHVVNVDPKQVVEDLSIEVNLVEQSLVRVWKVPPFGPDVASQSNKKIMKGPTETGVLVTETLSTELSTVNVRFSPSVERQQLASEKGLSGQFVFLYDVERSFSGGEIQVVNGYFVHFFAPDDIEEGDKHVIFVLDRSGSMDGTKMQQTKDAMKFILNDLKPTDYFNILTFADDLTLWKSESLKATESAKEEAKMFVKSIVAMGGTNIKDSIARGIELLQRSSNSVLASMLIFLTDGQPTVGETRVESIVSHIRSANPTRSVAIHSIGFGNDVDFDLLRKISTQNSGVARKIYEDSDSDLQLQGFYGEISSPLLSNVTVSYLNESAVEVVEEVNFNYYRGGEMLVVGQLRGAEVDRLKAEIFATSRDGPERFSIERICPPQPFPLPPGAIMTSTPHSPLPTASLGGFVERMWAYLSIKKLLEKAKYNEEDQTNAKALKERALQLSLKYNFVTELTSMVVTLPDDLKPSKNQTYVGLEEAKNENVDKGGLSLMSSLSYRRYPQPQYRSGIHHKSPMDMSAESDDTNYANPSQGEAPTEEAEAEELAESFADESSGAEAEETQLPTTTESTTIPTTTAHECAINETFNPCGNHCDKRCGLQKQPICTRICNSPSCACKRHFYRNASGDCVAKHDCPKQIPPCGENEAYHHCSNACQQRSCEDYQTPRICTRVCEPPRCECKYGFVRNFERKCVSPSQCPTISLITDVDDTF